MAFLFAEWVKRGGAIPKMPELVKELTTPTYTFRNGKFALEEKDQIKARLGFSCDFFDAAILSFALPEMPSNLYQGIPIRRQVVNAAEDYDPFSSERVS